jgi:hypothetical protein
MIQNARGHLRGQVNYDETSNLPDYIIVLQFSNALLGLVSLSLGALDFLRLHPRSFWATTPPSRLCLGLVDISPETRSWSFFVWLYACSNMLSRGFVYTFLAYIFVVAPIFSTGGGGPRLLAGKSWVVGIIAIVVFILNCLLLIPMKSWLILPASFISMFINIPWVAAQRNGRKYVVPYVCLPSWVMEFLYWLGSIVMSPIFFFSDTGGFSCTGSGYSHHTVVPFWLMFVTFCGILLITLLSLTFFMALSGRVVYVRRRYFKVHGKPKAGEKLKLDAVYADLNIPRSMPVLKYRLQRSGCCGILTMVLETSQ